MNIRCSVTNSMNIICMHVCSINLVVVISFEMFCDEVQCQKNWVFIFMILWQESESELHNSFQMNMNMRVVRLIL